MSGLGAWSYGYYRYGMQVPDARVGRGIIAFKQLLGANGFGKGIDFALEVFGSNMSKQTKAFQKSAGIKDDGVIGLITAMHLMRESTLAVELEGTIEIPDRLVQRQGRQESGHDPVAQGYVDPLDEGWAQRHKKSWTQADLYIAWDPQDAAHRMGSALKTFFVDRAADWDGAVASWNVGPQTAQDWVEAGKPASGGPIIAGQDFWTRATHYVVGVRSQPV